MRPSVRSLLLATLVAAGCSSAPRPTEPLAPTAPLRLTLVGTNDFHGWVMPHDATLSDGTVVEQGGAAVFAGYVARLRADNPDGVLLVDAGDLFQGTLASNLTEGAVVIEAYNRLGYVASALGNHEFDYGPVGPSAVPKAGEDAFGALKARIQQARFPLLAANVRELATGERPAWLGNDGTMLVTVKGVKVGLVGLITPSTKDIGNPTHVSTLSFEELLPATLEAAARLRAQGAEVVVGLAHAGGRCPKLDDPRDLSSCDRQNGEIYGLLESMPPGTLDALVAGHTHQSMGHFFGDVPVISTQGKGRSFGIIELFVDPATHRVLPELTRIQAELPVCGAWDTESHACDAGRLKGKKDVHLEPATFLGGPVVADASVEALMAPALARVKEVQGRPLGVSAPVRIGRDYEGESELGSFLADSLREMEGADVVLLNAGGLRADLRAGPVRYGDVYEVLPFDNTVATVTLTGGELRRLLDVAYGARNGIFQESGLKVTLSRCPTPERLRAVTLADGRPLEPQRLYKVVMPDFLARGADGLAPVLSEIPPERMDLGLGRERLLRDALAEGWRQRGQPLVAPAMGRIAYVDDGTTCAERKEPNLH